jgi:hypothetical protein
MSRRFAITLCALAAAAVSEAQAKTTFNFEGSGLSQNNNIPQTYGDFASDNGSGISVSLGLSVQGTPNVDLTWGNGVDHSVDWYDGWDGRGAVAQVDYNLANPISITFTPDALWGVLISSFDLDAWAGGGDMSVAWSISDALGTLASNTWSRNSGGRDSVLTGLNANDLHAGQAVTLTFQGLSGDGSYFGLDNISFDQVPATVPEPSIFALIAVGGIAGASRCLRRQKP